MEQRGNRKWLVLAAFAGTALVSQMLWLNFATIAITIQNRYTVDESTANLLTLVFPLLYLVFSIPSGILIDRKGYRVSVLWGSFVQAAASCIRIYDESFYALLAGQVGIAVAQPFIVNGISKLAADWFEEDQGAAANGIGTVGMFAGMALALGLTPVFVERWGLRTAMIIFSLISVAAAAVYALVDRKSISASKESTSRTSFGPVLKDKRLQLLFFLAFLGLGFFNGLTAWLEQILAPRGINAIDAGIIGSALIVGGIVGAAIVPNFSDKFKRRKPFLLSCVVAAVCLTYPLGMGSRFTILVTLAASLGFFFLPAFALLLEMCSEVAGEKHTGAATGILMLTGNAGGVVVMLAMDAIRFGSPSYDNAVYLLVVLLAIALFASVFLPETYGAKSIEDK